MSEPKKYNSNWSRNFPPKKKICRICQEKGDTQWHHIISQAKSKRIDRLDLISNFDNVVELCVPCHDLTTSSGIYRQKQAEKKYVCKSCNQIGHFTDNCTLTKKEKFRNPPPIIFFKIRNIIRKNCMTCGRNRHHKNCTYETYFDDTPIFIPYGKVISMPLETWENHRTYSRALALSIVVLFILQ